MPDSGSFEFGPFRLDAEKRVLWRDGELVPLTPKALDLLHALVEHGGDVVSKEELFGRVWPDAAVEEANLSVTVSALRKALDPRPGGGSYVQTVPRRGYRFDAPIKAHEASQELGLAVLPFACLGPETEAHLGIALADALISRLTEAEGLRVRPTGAVAAYAVDPKPPREAARELGVDAVLTGTLQRDAGRVRVSLQLVPLPAALRPWAHSFDTDWTDLFSVQDEVAERVTQVLSLRLARGRESHRHRPEPAAYEAYLRGRYFWARWDPTSLGKAFAYFGEAAGLDPAFAAPHAGLADAHLLLGLGGVLAPSEAWGLSEACADRALALDPSLAEAHVARAYARLFRDWDWEGTRLALERAKALGPGLASVHLWQGLFLALTGDFSGADAAVARGRAIDPLSGFAVALRCFLHEIAGEYEKELALARRAVELRPDHFLGYWSLGHASVLLGKMEAGQAALQRAIELTDGGPVMRAHLAWALVRAGDEDEARRRLEALDAVASNTFVSPCQRAAVLGALGDLEGGLRRIEEGMQQRDPWAVFAGASPLLAPYRAEPRFQGLLRRMGLEPGSPGSAARADAASSDGHPAGETNVS